jgi:hypothetical protein
MCTGAERLVPFRASGARRDIDQQEGNMTGRVRTATKRWVATRRWRVAAAAVAVGALAVAPALFASPAGAGQPKGASVAVMPHSISAGQTGPFTFVFTNVSSNSDGTVTVTAPHDLTITSANFVPNTTPPPSPLPKGAMATSTGTTATFSNLGLKPGNSFTFAIYVTVAQCVVNTENWSVVVGIPSPSNPTPVTGDTSVNISSPNCEAKASQVVPNGSQNTTIDGTTAGTGSITVTLAPVGLNCNDPGNGHAPLETDTVSGGLSGYYKTATITFPDSGAGNYAVCFLMTDGSWTGPDSSGNPSVVHAANEAGLLGSCDNDNDPNDTDDILGNEILAGEYPPPCVVTPIVVSNGTVTETLHLPLGDAGHFN